MFLKSEWKILLLGLALFLVFYFIPVGHPRFDNAILEAIALAQWYAREHFLLCLVPAFFIAGAIAVFISQEGVLKYLGPTAPKYLSYPVASVSGSVLAVCSCTVLPLFAGISARGAGIGPATAFLYAGPAINVLAIILTANILGFELGMARAIGAVLFSIVIGLLMHLIFLRDEQSKATNAPPVASYGDTLPLWKTVIYFGLMIGILVFANWGKPEHATGIMAQIHAHKWEVTGLLSLLFAVVLVAWFRLRLLHVFGGAVVVTVLALLFPGKPEIPFSAGVIALAASATAADGEPQEWMDESWSFAKQIVPLLFVGVLIAGFLLGMPGGQGLVPSEWVTWAVGGNSLRANLFASVAGAFMYFATLTEVPIVEGLLGSGMGKGPALALLLAGPALSLPNMLVIRSVMGTKKTAVFVTLTCVMATLSGLAFGAMFD